MTNALFKLTYDELRERFVRARFAEEQEFGNESIEGWLEEQRHADKPAGDVDERPWNRYACLDAMLFVAHGKELQTLRSYAEPSDAMPHNQQRFEFKETVEDRRWLAPLIEVLHTTKVKLYYGNA